MSKPKRDLNQEITDKIIEAIESGAADPNGWRAPWSLAASAGLPHNAVARRPYNGINVLLLWATAIKTGYPTHEWATYRQWTGAGAQVRGGEKSTMVVLYKTIRVKPGPDEEPDGKEDDGRVERKVMRAFSVFNAAQVDGYERPDEPELEPAVLDETIEAWVALTGAEITYNDGHIAAWEQISDRISIPRPELFEDVERFHSTRFHELTHWTGHESRLARDLSGRFGDKAYAAEELIAELGAAFTCGQFAIEHVSGAADYVANWLTLLRDDNKAITTAASAASRAVAFLNERTEVREVVAA